MQVTFIITFLIFLLYATVTPAQQKGKRKQDSLRISRYRVEQPLKNGSIPLQERLNFELSSKNKGAIQVQFRGDVMTTVNLKVYDLIGNLLHETTVKINGNQQYNIKLPEVKSRFFIVEVGNKQYNLTKSVVSG
jgi:hypothetical protein